MEARTALITGAGQGLGKAFAKHFAGRGTKVVIAEKNAETGAAAAQEISKAGGTAIFVETDVAQSASIQNAVDHCVTEFGGLDILINNAALLSQLRQCPFEEITDDEWDQAMKVNVAGVFYGIRAAAPVMKKAGWGRIVNMSSNVVLAPPPVTFVHYVTSKAAVVGITRATARELGPHGITVNAILPGATETEVTRVPEIIENRKKNVIPGQCIPRQEIPEDLVSTAYFLTTDEAGFVTGQCLAVDGGFSFS